jgi:hypothetical protein
MIRTSDNHSIEQIEKTYKFDELRRNLCFYDYNSTKTNIDNYVRNRKELKVTNKELHILLNVNKPLSIKKF